MGKQKAYEMRLDAAIKERLNTIEEEDGIKAEGYDSKPKIPAHKTSSKARNVSFNMRTN